MLKIVDDENYGLVYVDKNNNMWNADYYTEAEAEILSYSLENCRDCYNCAHSFNCVNCRECVVCIDCDDCENCSACEACSSCIDCHYSAFQYCASGITNVR